MAVFEQLAEEVGRELKRFKETTDKPIITSMGDSAASAAYWLAAYSDTIYANPSTLTGSIGVYMPYMNTQELFKKIGIYTTKIKSGQYKDIMSADRPMTQEEQQILQNISYIVKKKHILPIKESVRGNLYDKCEILRVDIFWESNLTGMQFIVLLWTLQESCQKSIWSQIDGGNVNDYSFFHMRKADGTYISVLDHGLRLERRCCCHNYSYI